jgi:DNA polymerase-3 subunit delta'
MQLSELQPVSAPLPWQADLWRQLSEQATEGILPHAIILTGPQFIGKEPFALALARLLLCHSEEDGLNCGNCPACELSAAGNHGDLRWLQPEEDSRVVKIDQVRQAIEFVGKTPAYGQRKVLVISPADSMNASAANALLKCLEEPPGETYFVLVCSRLQAVPATVRSRCRIQRMATPQGALTHEWLSQLTGDETSSAQLLQLAEQRPLLAERLFLSDDTEAFAARRQALRALMTGEAPALDVAAALKDMEPMDLLDQLWTELNGLLSSMEAGQLRQSRSRSVFGLLDEIRNIQRALDGGSNPNAQLLVEALLTRTQEMLGDSGSGANIGAVRGGAIS